MSRAFVKEDASPDQVVVPARAPLPTGTPNLVTVTGLAALAAERDALEAERQVVEAAGRDEDRGGVLLALDEQLADLAQRIASARVAAAPDEPDVEVAIGSSVTLRRDDGRVLQLRIVGVDEAAPERGWVAFTAPVAQALLGRRVGDSVKVAAGTLTVEAVRFVTDDAGVVPSTSAAGG